MLKQVLIIWLLFQGMCYSGSLHENIDDAKYIEFGKKFECVIPIEIYDNSPMSPAFGSGVIINTEWILTAAHGLVGAKKIIIKVNEKKYSSVKIIPHPDFRSYEGKNDIALVKFPKIENFDKFPTLNTDTDLLQRNVVIAGYGMVCIANNPSEIKFDGIRRAGSNTSIDIEDHMIICSMDRENNSELEFVLNSGDSGGGLFLKGDLAGINSCLIATDGKADGSYGDKCGHTRIDLFLDWIRNNIKN